MNERIWTDDMGELSGMGGGYELSIRAMVIAGLAWLEAPENEHAIVVGKEYENVTGFVSAETPAARQLMEHMAEVCMDFGMTLPDDEPEMDDGEIVLRARPTVERTRESYSPSGAMMQWAFRHALMAHKLGWEAYCNLRRKVTDEDEAAGAPC